MFCQVLRDVIFKRCRPLWNKATTCRSGITWRVGFNGAFFRVSTRPSRDVNTHCLCMGTWDGNFPMQLSWWKNPARFRRRCDYDPWQKMIPILLPVGDKSPINCRQMSVFHVTQTDIAGQIIWVLVGWVWKVFTWLHFYCKYIYSNH